MNMKKNAKEYLLEFAASQEDWLKALIYDAIETNGDISRDRKNEIYTALRDSANISFVTPNIASSDDETNILLKKLHHKKGVNALQEDQVIKFHEDVTILYGMNGVGKSSYFKILNEIVGGNQKKEILPNIYAKQPQDVDVEVSYERTTATSINWDGSSRSLDGFNNCKVFDTSYLNGLLETREADTTLIKPLGLNLFTYLIGLIDQYKDLLANGADKVRAKKPNIDLTNLSETIKLPFLTHKLLLDQRSNIEKLFDFPTASSLKLDEKTKELEGLKQVNIKDKIKILTDEQARFKKLIGWLNDRHSILSKLTEGITRLIADIKSKKIASNKAKEQFEVLRNIPENDTDEWKEFVVAGQKYSKSLDGSDDVCPYCWQELKTDNSVKIIQSFGLYLKDNSEQELTQSAEALKSKLKAVEAFPLDFEVDDSTVKVLKKKIIDGTTLYDSLKAVFENFRIAKAQLVASIENEDEKTSVSIQDISLLGASFQAIQNEITSKIEGLSKEDSEKAKKIEALEQELKVLLENKSINLQKNAIQNWFSLTESENNLRKKANRIKSRLLSTLSTKAHNELLTKALKQKFSDELGFIGHSGLDVKLETTRTTKGVSNTRLVLLESSKAITSILSEGEQKAVALALFLAEIGMQKVANPIILDDPVNSLDHRIAEKFAERLLSLDNQVILFNHNRFFLDYFETSKKNHICKSIDSDCNNNKGKHIRVYDVISQGKSSKGILKNYKGNKAKNHLKEVKGLLQKIPFDEETKVAGLIRLSIECVIDEVVFNNQVPTKYSNKNSRIGWAELKKVNNDSQIIDSLERIHGRASGGEMHNGSEKYENPIDVDEFNGIVDQIESILSSD